MKFTKLLNLKDKIILATKLGKFLFFTLGLLFIALGLSNIILNYLKLNTETLKLKNEIHSRISSLDSKKENLENYNYEIIAKNSIFGQITPQSSNSDKKDIPKVSNADLILIGTYLNDQDSYAIVSDKKTNNQDIFTIGQSIFNTADLLKVSSESIEIKRDGKNEILYLDDGNSSPGETTKTASNDSINVSETELNEALANIPLLLTQARAVPYFQDGQSVGLRLFAIKPGSLFEKIGLKNGDILKSVNDSSLGDITQAVQLFEKLKSEKSISVKLERNKEETELKYSIG